jgi:hypothetical protein
MVSSVYFLTDLLKTFFCRPLSVTPSLGTLYFSSFSFFTHSRRQRHDATGRGRWVDGPHEAHIIVSLGAKRRRCASRPRNVDLFTDDAADTGEDHGEDVYAFP